MIKVKDVQLVFDGSDNRPNPDYKIAQISP